MSSNLSNLSLVNKPKNKLLTLVMMQLKNKLNLNVKKNKKGG